MIRFGELPEVMSGLIGCWFFFLMLADFCVFIPEFGRKRKYRIIYRIVIALEILANYFVLQSIMSANDAVLTNKTAIRLVEMCQNTTVMGICILAIIQTIPLVFFIRKSVIWDKNHITSNSLKEAVDTLPAGVCAYDMNGRVILKNVAMERLCISFTGKMLFNGLQFEQAVENYPDTDKIGIKKVYILPDKSAYIFSREELSINGSKRILFCAFDMTEEYEKTQLLLQKEKDVQELNASLVAYNRDIVSIVTSQEILNAKVKIHDELGAGLLSIRHYLINGGGEIAKQNIISKLSRNIKFLQSEMEEKQKDEYKLMITTAKTLGVDIEVEGELPEEEPFKHIIATAIHECFTNTVRHAKGNLLRINVSEDENRITCIFTNNGERPLAPISEKGGLASLRSLVETAGGIMSINIENGFELCLFLKKEKINGI